jgi:hypothetical protein
MPAKVTSVRYPCTRVLLPRTRLAYVHLRNLLNDAKRDRSARVSGYVAIWLPEDFLLLYLQRGEVVNATRWDGRTAEVVPIATAIATVPSEPEYGEICFHEADDVQLACMFASQSMPADPWPAELRVADASALFPYLMAVTFDGVLEIQVEGTVNYLLFRDGGVQQAYLATAGSGTLVERVSRLFAAEHRSGLTLRRWPGELSLPSQAPPALIQAYRELTAALVQRLVTAGKDGAPAVAEHARMMLLSAHPALEAFSFNTRAQAVPMRDPVADSPNLTAAVAALIKEVVWAVVDHDGVPPEELLRELTWERRHLFQSAGLFDRIPWKVM